VGDGQPSKQHHKQLSADQHSATAFLVQSVATYSSILLSLAVHVVRPYMRGLVEELGVT